MTSLFPDLAPMHDESFADLVTRLEANQTPTWAIKALLRHEFPHECEGATFSHLRFLDPCVGLGAIGEIIRLMLPNAEIICNDLYDWTSRPDVKIGDFLDDQHADWLGRNWHYDPWHIMMNPPFSQAVNFVDQGIRLAPMRIYCFQDIAWFTSSERRKWWDRMPLARILLCGNRATCKRFDMLHVSMSTPKTYAWFVFETDHNPKKPPTIERIYKGRA